MKTDIELQEKIKRSKRSLPNVFKNEHLVAIFNQFKDPQYAMICFVALITGLRISEVAKLKWEDLDFEERRIKVVCGKYYRDRYVPLAKNGFVEILYLWRVMNKEEKYVFPSKIRPEGHICKSEIGRIFDSALKKAGLKVVRYTMINGRNKYVHSFHTLRHTFCTWLLESGMDVYDVQKVMGHAHIDTTMRYTHIAHSIMRKKFDDVFNSKQEVLNKTEKIKPRTSVQADPIKELQLKLVREEISENEYLKKMEIIEPSRK